MLVLKVGGSVFGRDAASPAVDRECLLRLADELRPYLGQVVVVHGAGHYPRNLLPRACRGDRIPASGGAAVVRLRRALERISEQVIRVWMAAGLPVECLPPGLSVTRRGDEILLSKPPMLRSALAQGRLPVLRGDVFPDGSGDFRIVSSDRVTEATALGIGADRVIWATDVDGVLAPGSSGPHYLATLTVEDLVAGFPPGASTAAVEGRSSGDSGAGGLGSRGTGEMAGKLRSVLRLARAGVASIIVNGRVEGRVAAALAGLPVRGTEVSPNAVSYPLDWPAGSTASTDG